ncbi:hypothetical protein DERF_009259 [Dermatophagoides farinae]|uniref:Uncharacterized protein n=1 Tax=Dermatophagoides farinae TaxID=6954 RepID=A0A922HYS5_DERFA|nr:hypothetical protein DERF_009259 [Dermatophagoides farinae]
MKTVNTIRLIVLKPLLHCSGRIHWLFFVFRTNCSLQKHPCRQSIVHIRGRSGLKISSHHPHIIIEIRSNNNNNKFHYLHCKHPQSKSEFWMANRK